MSTKDDIEKNENVDDSYGNKDNIRDAKDINFDLRNSIKNNLYISVPANTNGVDFSNYIVKDSTKISKNTIVYSDDMTIAEKVGLLIRMKNNIRNQIIKNLKGGSVSDFYDSDENEKIPFVAYWKMIKPLEKPTHITLKVSSTKTSWVKNVTIKATLYDNSNVSINGAKLYLYKNGQSIANGVTKNGSYTFTISVNTSTKETYEIRYNGVSSKYAGCTSNKVTINFIEDTPTLKALSNNNIYQGYSAKYQLLNSQGKPITNTPIKIKVGDGSWKEYLTNNNGIVSIKITKKTTVYYKFEGVNKKYKSISQKSQSFTIKSNENKTKCAGTMTQSPTSRTKPYQIWSDIYSDCTTANYLRCGHESTGYSNVNTLGSNSGTFHQPATLIKSNWDLGVPKDAIVKSVHLKWSEKQTNGPSVSTSKTSFINIKKVTITISVSGTIIFKQTINTNSGGKTNGGNWVMHDLNLGSNFDPTKKVTLKLAYGPNESPNTGTIYVKGPQIIVEYIPAEE